MPLTLVGSSKQTIGTVKSALSAISNSKTSYSYTTLSQTVHTQALAVKRVVNAEGKSNYLLTGLDSNMGILERAIKKVADYAKSCDKDISSVMTYVNDYLRSPKAEEVKGQGVSKLIAFYNKYRNTLTNVSSKMFSDIKTKSNAAWNDLASAEREIQRYDRSFNPPLLPVVDFIDRLTRQQVFTIVERCLNYCGDLL